jgi:membrane peptidoglycan carboxypeptidase
MPDVVSIIQRRRDRRLKARKQSDQRRTGGFAGAGMFLALMLGLLIFTITFAYADVVRDLPSTDQLPALFDRDHGALIRPSRIMDRTGEHTLLALAPGGVDRRFVSIDPNVKEHLPPTLSAAIIARYDPAFWNHNGYSLDGIFDPNVHPTLAQKLIADLILWNEPPSLRRSIRERIFAAQITQRFGREQILEWFINSANYGRYAYGADAAAQLYFGKPASKLTLAEAAMLAGVSQSPSLNPIDAPQAALQLQQETLAQMEWLGLASSDSIKNAKTDQVNIRPAPVDQNLAPAFTTFALSQLDSKFHRERFERGGMDLITTLDYDVQMQSACIMQTHLARLNNDLREISAPDGSACAGARLLSPNNATIQNLSASVVILDPTNGQVIALVGEVRAGVETQSIAPHRIGTMITPFIYLTGFTRGVSPSTMIWDLPNGLTGDITIQNFRSQYHGPVRARVALANDYLVPAMQIINQMGADATRKTLQAFGLNNSSDLFAEDNRVSPLTLAHAYAGFAAEGIINGQSDAGTLKPYALLALNNADHQRVMDWETTETRQIVTPQLAYLINHALADALSRKDFSIPDLGRPFAVKAGRSIDGIESWTAGYTPRRVALVWAGADQPIPASITLDAWRALMQYASRSIPAVGWEMPPGVSAIRVCDPSGMIPTDACPNIVNEIFLNGNEPVQLDNLYQSFEINRETGLLATALTPLSLIEDRVFMVPPEEAREWANEAGLPVPPQMYDSIQPGAADSDARITSPITFADARGKITIKGSAGGEDFSFYRLQAGRGLNPREWVLISDGTTPISNTTLGAWDTSGLDGLYTIQLIVVRGDQSLTTTAVFVVIDHSQ